MIIDTTRKFSKPRHLHRTAFDAVQVRGVMRFLGIMSSLRDLGILRSNSTILSSLRDYYLRTVSK